MLADRDLLLIAVFCTADDLLPVRPKNARRMLTDAEVVTLCVAQSLMGHTSDERFLMVARKQLVHLFPRLTQRSGFHKRRDRLSETIEALIGVFAHDSPGFHDDVVLVDSTPVECGRSIETSRRSQLADAADFGYCTSHSRSFWGFRLHALFGLDGTRRALASPYREPRLPGVRSAAAPRRETQPTNGVPSQTGSASCSCSAPNAGSGSSVVPGRRVQRRRRCDIG